MLRLRKLYLFLFFVSVADVSAYTPITWIEGIPNNLFSPPCFANVHGKFKKCSTWQGHVRANLFSVVQPKEYYYSSEGYGLALQGHIHLDRLLQGLYGQLYVPALLVHKKGSEWNWSSRQEKSYSGYFASIADIPFLIGWEAIQRKSWHFSGYFVGTIPTSKHELFHHGSIQPFVSYNDQFSCAPGLESFVRLWGKPKHHIDWHLGADITFWRGINGTGVITNWTNDSGTLVPTATSVPVRIHANRMYRVQSDLSYKFKHFISDLGTQYLHIPEEKFSLINPPPTPVNTNYNFSQQMLDVFLDVGMEMQLAKLPSYVTIGVQSRIAGTNVPPYLNINVKLGTQF